MNLKNTQKALQAFSSNVERKAKANLKRKNKIASGDLYNSIKGDLKVNKNSFELFFNLSDYWEFVDYGVKGVGGTKADGSKWKLKKVTNNKFKYKDKKPPTIALNGWTIRKGIAPRDNSGRFTSRKGLLIAITKSIYHTGLETTSFFTRPFDIEFAKLEKNIVDSYALDVENFLEFSLKE